MKLTVSKAHQWSSIQSRLDCINVWRGCDLNMSAVLQVTPKCRRLYISGTWQLSEHMCHLVARSKYSQEASIQHDWLVPHFCISGMSVRAEHVGYSLEKLAIPSLPGPITFFFLLLLFLTLESAEGYQGDTAESCSPQCTTFRFSETVVFLLC